MYKLICHSAVRTLIKKSTFQLISIVAIFLTSGPLRAKDIVICTAVGHQDVTITLNSERVLKSLVSCIQGEFIADLTPCAPSQGGFGLSAPTGSVSLIKLVKSPLDYQDHHGGIAAHRISDTKIYFSGGFNSDEGYMENWHFTADRLTGVAHLKSNELGEVTYACHPAIRRF